MKMNIGLIRFGILVICLASLALGVVHYNKVGGVIFDLSDYLTLDQSTPQTITGDTPKLDTLKSKSILGTDADGKIIEGTHQDLSELGTHNLTTTGLASLGSIKSGILYPSADSTTAVGIFRADGTTNVLNVDTTNSRVGIGTTEPVEKLDVVGNINIDEDSAYLFNGVNGLKLSKNGEAEYYSTILL